MRIGKTPGWVVLLTFAVTIVLVWVIGRWLLRMFIGIQGGRT